MFFDLIMLVLLVPLAIPFIARFVYHTTIDWREVGITTVVVFLVGIVVINLGSFNETADTELWNGQVTQTYNERYQCGVQSGCRHSYSCNCRRVISGFDSKGNARYTTICDTCWDYDWEQNWYVDTNIGRFEISRVDEQGRNTPERWAQVEIGEPVSKTNQYTNWVKAVPESMFNNQLGIESYGELIPEYPLSGYDYWHYDRVLTIGEVGLSETDLAEWNEQLHEVLGVVGPERQANIVMIVTDHASPNLADAITREWIGGKKNDILIFIGVKENDYQNGVAWVRINSWAKFSYFNAMLRNHIFDENLVEKPYILFGAIESIVLNYFERRSMEEFEYLQHEISPPLWAIVVAFVLTLATSLGLTYVFHRN